MEALKHECGVAMIRLLKPLEYYKKKYGTERYALNKLYLLMEYTHVSDEGMKQAMESNPLSEVDPDKD